MSARPGVSRHAAVAVLVSGVVWVAVACGGSGSPAPTGAGTTVGAPGASTDTTGTTDTIGTSDTPDPPDTIGTGVRPSGLDSVTVRIVDADGTVCEVCTWLADDVPSRGRGLMDVTDLDGRAGMAFVYPEPVSERFFMYSTPMPLSIAWFGADGAFVDAADMEPCLVADSASCPRYAPSAAFVLALEVPRGELEALGIGPGSTVVVVPGTRASDCP